MDPDELLPTVQSWSTDLSADARGTPGCCTITLSEDDGWDDPVDTDIILTREQLVRCIQLIDNDARNRRMSNA
jgi:hypothetical protein